MSHPHPPRPGRRHALQKPWNLSAILLAVLAIVMLLTAVASVDQPASRTGDYLELAPGNDVGMLRREQGLPSLLKRDRDGYQPSAHDGESEKTVKVMTVKMGLYAMNNYNIDLQVPSFEGSGYWWMKWDDKLQTYLKENNLKIWRVMAPINLLDIPQSSESVFVPTGKSEPIRMNDGSWYITGSYSGTFFVDRIDFRRHPFTMLSLPIMIEADDIVLSNNRLRLIPDVKGSGIGQFVHHNTGWVNRGWSLTTYRHHYDTDFGFGEGASDYSQLVFAVKYASSTWSAFWKVLVPLVIVVAMIAGATKLDTTHYDVRLTLPVTVLLTLVFMQQSHDTGLPRLPYLTFLDEVYVVAYILTLISFIMMLWACRRYYKAIQLEDPELRAIELEKLDRSDDYWPTYVILAGIISLTIAWFTG
ncbi:MAG: hypothetical protein RLZZ117_127 [Cyanobacteriota bacterium]|jgi:hypothetical protein